MTLFKLLTSLGASCCTSWAAIWRGRRRLTPSSQRRTAWTCRVICSFNVKHPKLRSWCFQLSIINVDLCYQETCASCIFTTNSLWSEHLAQLMWHYLSIPVEARLELPPHGDPGAQRAVPELGLDLDVLVEVFALLRGKVVGLQPLPVVLVHLWKIMG